MSGSLLTPINVASRLEAEIPRTNKEIVEKLHKAILDHNFILAEELAAALKQDRSTADTYICNITEQDFGPLDMWHYMAGVFIPGKKSGDRYSIYKMVPHTDHMDLGDMRTLDVPIPSYDSAVDVCDKFNGHIGRGSYAGLFVIEGGRSVPSEKELAEADAKLLSWDQALIREGDRYYDLNRRADISDLHRNACRRRNVKKPWLPENLPQSASCPACGSDIKENIATCPHCKVILDAERYARFSFADGRPSVSIASPAVPVASVVDEPDLMSEPEEELVSFSATTTEVKPLRQRI